MNFIKRLIPNHIKQKGKNFLYDLLKIQYTTSGVSLDIINALPTDKPISFIDIGANAGHFSLGICKAYEVSSGVLVEPLQTAIPLLNSYFPDKQKFKIVNAAISDSNGETTFYINPDFDSVSSLLKIYNENEDLKSLKIQKPVATKVKTITLDNLTGHTRDSIIDLIKIDVQGAEHLVLKGGIETLKKTKIIYTEFSFKPLYENSSTFYDLYIFLNDNNFILSNISPGYTSSTGELLQGDALFINKDFKSGKL